MFESRRSDHPRFPWRAGALGKKLDRFGRIEAGLQYPGGVGKHRDKERLGMRARIYRPAKNAMQSGKARIKLWLLEYEPETPRVPDPLMGWTSSSDMRQQLALEFETRQEAIAYAEQHGIPYQVYEPHAVNPRAKSYSDNFRFDRKQPWSH